MRETNPLRMLIVSVSTIEDDGHRDIASYNKELEQRGNPQWHDVPWLFSECYLCKMHPDPLAQNGTSQY